MRKAVWIAFIVSLVLVNLGAWLAELATGFYIPVVLRLFLVLGITVGTTVFAGAFALVSKFDEERPLTGHGNDTLQERPANQPTQRPSTTKSTATPSADESDHSSQEGESGKQNH